MFPFKVSPDESRVAYSAGAGMQEMEVWVMSLANGASTRITFRGGASPIWSPDGKFVYYNRLTGVGRKAADGSGEENLLTKASVNDQLQSVSPDGKVLLFGGADILKLPLSGGGKVEPYRNTNSVERDAAFSPDGRWVAYTSNESGRAEIYIQGYPELRGKWLVSTSGGRYPAWRQDGRELYWVALDGTTLVAANIELLSDTIRSARPQSLFSLPPAANFRFQPSRDGQRFLMHEPDADAKLHRSMVVMQNWAARLEK